MKHAYFLYTGYGKTKLCLDKIINATTKPRTLLISTKNIVESSWSREIEKWYPGKLTYGYISGSVKEKDRLALLENPPDILGINTSMIDWYIKNSTDVKRKSYTKQGIKLHYDTDELINRFDLLIIDESSLFKNSQSGRFKLIKKWAHKIKNVLILSATPTPRDIEDVWSQIYLLDGGQRLGKNITEFRTNYGIPVPLPNGFNRYQYSDKAVEAILNLIKDITTSVPAPDVPLFPEPILRKTIIKADPVTADMISRFKDDFIIELSNGETLIAFSKIQMMNKVSQLASGAVYDDHVALHVNDVKLNALKRLLSQINTPVLVPYIYVFDREKLLTLPGARLLSTPQDFLDWNANLIPIGIISPSSAAHGLNLQDSECRDIIWFSPIWDTEKWIQLNARVARRGQRYQITIRVLLLKDSYDDYAFELCQDKFRVQYNNLIQLRRPV